MAGSRIDEIKNILLNSEYSNAILSPQSRVEYLLLTLLAQGAGGGGSGGGEGGGETIHVCSSDEYNAITGVPIIASPSESVIYFVPNGETEGNDRYAEWRYVNGAWEKTGDVTDIPNAFRPNSDGEYVIDAGQASDLT